MDGDLDGRGEVKGGTVLGDAELGGSRNYIAVVIGREVCWMKGGCGRVDWMLAPYRFPLGIFEEQGTDCTEGFLSGCAKVSRKSGSSAACCRNFTPSALPRNSYFDSNHPDLFTFLFLLYIYAIFHYVSSQARCRLHLDLYYTYHPV